MTFWTSDIDIKQKFRFIIEIADGFFLPNVKTCSKPSSTTEIKEFQLINHVFKYPGIVKWNDIKITMVDMGGKAGGGDLDTSVLLWRMLMHSGYKIPTTGNDENSRIALLDSERNLTTPEKASTVANSFGSGLTGKGDFDPAGVNESISNRQSVKIYQLDGDGKEIELWVLHNPQIKGINWGELSYEDDGAVECTLDICYDWAELAPKLSGDKITAKTVENKYTDFMTNYYKEYKQK